MDTNTLEAIKIIAECVAPVLIIFVFLKYA